METQGYFKHCFLPGWITPRYEFPRSWEGGWVMQTSFWSKVWKIWKLHAQWFSFSSILLLLLSKEVPQSFPPTSASDFLANFWTPKQEFSAIYFFPWIFTLDLHGFFCSVGYLPLFYWVGYSPSLSEGKEILLSTYLKLRVWPYNH